MSKRDKPNRFPDKPQFEEIRPTGADSRVARLAQTEFKPVVYDLDEEEGMSYFNFSGIGTFLGGCWGKLTAFSLSAVSKTWGCCRSVAKWMWIGLRKIPSYCVIHWDSEDEIEFLDTTAKKPESDKMERNRKIAPNDRKEQTAPKNINFDEDELTPSPWWNIGIKIASATVAVLVCIGGYFAVKPLLFTTPTEMAEADVEILAVAVPSDILSPPEAVSVAEVTAPERQSTKEKPTGIATPAPPAPSQVVEATPKPVSPLQGVPPSQGSLLDNDPFLQAAAPAVAESAPPIGNDPFGEAIVAAAPSVPPPTVPSTAPPPNSPKNLTALQPLASLDSVPITQSRPQLQPLVALDSSAMPLAVVAAPAAAPASANAQVASNYNSRQTANNRRQTQRQSQRSNFAFGEAPTAPEVNAMPQMAVQPTMAVIEPVREIVPQIPSSGTVQAVPQPPAPPSPVIAEVPRTRSVYANESAPAIPKDAPATSMPVPVVAVPAPSSTPQLVSVDSQPLDWQLWEQLRELRDEPEAEPSHLRLEGTTVAEPALRFTPKTAPAANIDNTVLHEAAEQFQALLPEDDLSPNSSDIEIRLPALEHAPQAVFSEALPKYRNNRSDGERGMTFQSRINSEIKRSPSATETYIVQQGDTYMTISDKFYGTSLLYSALAEHNRNLGIGWQPAEGVVIEIPTAEYLRTYYNQQRRLGSERPTIRYIVQEGDTIFRLATDKLQDTNRWREIYAMNSDRIQDVRDLKPGTEILLPVESAHMKRQQIQ